jgi:predicted glutamine amidotransferase
MCGIVGAMSLTRGLTLPARKFFEDALYADALRGEDSTGVYMYSKQKKVENKVLKKPVCAVDFMWDERVSKQFLKLGDYNLVLGHNRAATKGGITRANAHPFQDGDICMVHNGTLFDKTTLPDHTKYVVDSRAICHSIATIGIEATAPLLKGSYSLVWVDHRAKTLNFFRNSERPMFFGYSEKEQCLFWASEYKMLDWILDRRKIYDVEILKLKEDTLVTYTLAGNEMKVTASALEVFTPPKWNGNYDRYGYAQGSAMGGAAKDYRSVKQIASSNKRSKTKSTTSGTKKTSEPLITIAGRKNNTKHGRTTTRPVTKVTNIADYRRPPKRYPKIGEIIDAYLFDRTYDSSSSRYCAFGYSWDDDAVEIECHNIRTMAEIACEGVYSVKVVNVVYSADLHEHVVLCAIDHPVEVEGKFEDQQGDADVKEGEYLPKEGMTKGQYDSAVEEVIALNIAGKKDESYALMEAIMEYQDRIKKGHTSSDQCRGTKTSPSKEVILRPTPSEVLEITTKGLNVDLPPALSGSHVLGPDGQYIEQTYFNSLVRFGCVGCTHDISWRDAGSLYWVDVAGSYVKRPLCKVCCTDRGLQQDLGLNIPISVYLSRKKICNRAS